MLSDRGYKTFTVCRAAAATAPAGFSVYLADRDGGGGSQETAAAAVPQPPPPCTARHQFIYVFVQIADETSAAASSLKKHQQRHQHHHRLATPPAAAAISTAKLGIDSIRAIEKYCLLQQHPVEHVIVVHGSGGVTPFAMQNIQPFKLGNRTVYFELFPAKQLLINIAIYDYQIISDDDPRMEAWLGNSGEVNYILWSDPQRRYYDWPAGTVVQRSRQRGTLCEDRSIRIVQFAQGRAAQGRGGGAATAASEMEGEHQ